MSFRLPSKDQIKERFYQNMVPIHYGYNPKTTPFQKLTFVVDNLFYFGGRKITVLDATEQSHITSNKRTQSGKTIYEVVPSVKGRTAVKFEDYKQDDFLQACKLVGWLATIIGIVAFPQHRKKLIGAVLVLVGVKILTKAITFNRYIFNTDEAFKTATAIATGTYQEYKKINDFDSPQIERFTPDAPADKSQEVERAKQMTQQEADLEEVKKYVTTITEKLVDKLSAMPLTGRPQSFAENALKEIEIPTEITDLAAWVVALEEVAKDLNGKKLDSTTVEPGERPLFKDQKLKNINPKQIANFIEQQQVHFKKELENKINGHLLNVFGFGQKAINQWFAHKVFGLEFENVDEKFEAVITQRIENAGSLFELSQTLLKLQKMREMMLQLQIDPTDFDHILFTAPPKQKPEDQPVCLVHKKASELYEAYNENPMRLELPNVWLQFMIHVTNLLKHLQNLNVDENARNITDEEFAKVVFAVELAATQLQNDSSFVAKMFLGLIKENVGIFTSFKKLTMSKPTLQIGDRPYIGWMGVKFDSLNNLLKIEEKFKLKVESDTDNDEEMARRLQNEMNDANNMGGNQRQPNNDLVDAQILNALVLLEKNEAVLQLLEMDENTRNAYLANDLLLHLREYFN